ncbi:energy transducer TonB [Polaribacter litorisediminis]|uniref:energy transducer TonB n=1 Tax=Polaribacter litorisediminis TaxID=1908341 RepID=UPI001CBEFD0A|nr:energy transducer TonB [Polaribacter litorisediminis]
MMKNLKKLPSKQLEKFSTIFTQLGLVLVLFIVYLILEHQTPQKSLAIIDFNPPEVMMISSDQDIVFVKESKLVPKIERTSTVFVADEPIKKVDNTIIETVLVAPKEDLVPLNIDALVTAEEPKDEPVETLPFILIENAPVFKGCEGLSKEENKICFDAKMKKFVQRNFDAQLANEIGLNSGKYRISTQFVIDDQGNVVDIQIRAPHIKLKKETQALIEKLPKFTPGKQRDKAVKVKYTLPISFRVD